MSQLAIPTGSFRPRHYLTLATVSIVVLGCLAVLSAADGAKGVSIDVPGFSGIRIHPGNRPGDTDGCLLPGQTRQPSSVGNSVLACGALQMKLSAALSAGEPVTITIA